MVDESNGKIHPPSRGIGVNRPWKRHNRDILPSLEYLSPCPIEPAPHPKARLHARVHQMGTEPLYRLGIGAPSAFPAESRTSGKNAQGLKAGEQKPCNISYVLQRLRLNATNSGKSSELARLTCNHRLAAQERILRPVSREIWRCLSLSFSGN